ncbi:class I SAM-dependent methyltransferase [Methylorubrum extorquens]
MRDEITAARLVEGLVKSIFNSASMTVIDGSSHEQLVNIVDSQTTDTRTTEDLLRESRDVRHLKLLDFGCGTTVHRGMLESFGFDWRGINYSSVMTKEAAEASKRDQKIDFNNGADLPYEDSFFDVVNSYRTFEHIQNIQRTFSGIWRALRPGGKLIGQVISMEQIHYYCTFNFTPYSFKISFNESGLNQDRIYPKFDAITWLMRRLIICTSGTDRNSPFHVISVNNPIGDAFIEYGEKQGLSVAETNLARTMLGPHFVFEASRQ